MVKRQNFKKLILESTDDESDSDDFYEEVHTSEAQPKQYSLRQRKKTNFDEDFEYDVIEENDPKIATGTEALRSDDEDFDLNEAQKQESNIEPKPSSKPTSTKVVAPSTNCTVTKCQERQLMPKISHDKQSSADMIDFEDVIRADILVVDSKIDYDSVIEKSEIKIEPRKVGLNENVLKENENAVDNKKKAKSPKLKKSGEPGKKRGRKPKLLSEEDESNKNGYKRQKLDYTKSAGLPINTVLGVTESLYELAERYHLQAGMMNGEMEDLPLEPIITEDAPTEHSKNSFIGIDNEVSVQAEAGTIEIF